MIEIDKISDTKVISDNYEIRRILKNIYRIADGLFSSDEKYQLSMMIKDAIRQNKQVYDEHGLNNYLISLNTLLLFIDKIEADRNIFIAIILNPFYNAGVIDKMVISQSWGNDVLALLEGLQKVGQFSCRSSIVNPDNFRGLLLSLADDIRVIIIMIIRNLVIMRMINHHPDEEWVRCMAFEANCLYAQLAHRLGLYYIKGELEDLSLKYTNRDIFKQIAHKLNETKKDRDQYIASFIEPVKNRLSAAGLNFEIKGRTKSISSIWAKIKKQKVDIKHIYDLFAIRIIIDTPIEKEKSDCWLAYSIIADMYTANPARMKDWISIPKSNGYESLHTTVMGPESKWVEVQIRTKRMDLIAEKGLAAHWRYKGGKSDTTDQWMNNIRDILETAEDGPMALMRNMKMDTFKKEVFAFTPKGDLFRLNAGSTILDFAFHIHSRIGSQCTGAIVNGRHEKITYKIKDGDTIEIITNSNQTPKQEWLSIVVSSKAKNKIKQTLNEAKQLKADLGKELYERRIKNRKIEFDEAILMRTIKKMGYKFITDFFADIADEKIDVNRVISMCMDAERKDVDTLHLSTTSAEDFHINSLNQDNNKESNDVLVIGDKNIKGLNYKLSKCCSPIYGDDVFGFISTDGVVKIHKKECPNARHIMQRYPYRLIKVQWSGVAGEQLPVTLRIIGNDDIGIVTNITSIISKERTMNLRNISIDSNDGLFQGILIIGVSDTNQLNQMIRKLKAIKGVKDVSRT